MGKPFDRPILIQKVNDAEVWETVFNVHARVNKAKSDNEYLSGGATQGKRSLTFEVRFFKDIEDISYNTQLYRIVYQDVPFNIKDYDDYMLTHKTVKLLGVSY